MMHAIRKITDDLLYVGASDRRLALFENAYPVPDGASFNAYVLLDEETVLFDAVDRAVREPFLEQLDQALSGRALNYVFVHHVEPDHSATLNDVLARHPSAKLVLTAQAARMMAQFYHMDALKDALIVKDGDGLSTGRHRFRFVAAPMVHWPEVMFSFDETDGVLFSADAFGAYGALGGRIFADEMDERPWLDEARRYYTNIVGKYGVQVTAVLKKAAALDIKMICPLHGPIWRDDLSAILKLYARLSAYEPEEMSVMIAYASVYGHTERAATLLAVRLAERGVATRVFDTSKTDSSYLIAEAFRASHLVVAAPTYNMGVFPCMQAFIGAVTARGLKNRTVAVIENGSWAPNSGKLMAEALGAGNRVLDERVTIVSALNDESSAALDRLADALIASMPRADRPGEAVENAALNKLSYGLFVLTARENERDNGCIINTVTQLSDAPKRLTIAVNNGNLTERMIRATGRFNISVLDDAVPFSVIERFGFHSGRDTDKFEGLGGVERAENGISYLTEHVNAYLSCEVIESRRMGTHTLFVAEIVQAKALSDAPSVTYADYFDHIKPKPENLPKKKGFVCKICGYVYEGDELPPDFICPICKHGASDFEPLA